MLIIFPSVPKRPMFVVNTDYLNTIWIDNVNPPKVFLNIDGQLVPFKTVKAAEDTLNSIIDAYEQGKKVFRVTKESD